MSAPKTDIEKQKRRHSPALIGMAIAGAALLLIGAILLPQEIEPTDDRPAAETAGDGAASTGTD